MRIQFGVHVRFWTAIAVMVTAVLACPGASQAEVEEEIAGLRKELVDIKKELGDLKKELAEIQKIIQRARRPRSAVRGTARVSVSGRPSLGSPDAPVTMVEFSDYQCPYCKRYVSVVFPTIKRDYIDTGKLKYVFSDFPIASLHPQAPKAHEAAHCAGEQNQYWAMHDILFENSKDLSVPALKRYAEEVGLDGDQFIDCLQTGKYAGKVNQDIAAGRKAGVGGTPSFIIGPSGSGEQITGTILVGARPADTFTQVIDKALQAASKANAK
ncbi:MAG: thioredoxin domain-containing protein [Candidatus Methylomirabilales bacterium]